MVKLSKNHSLCRVYLPESPCLPFYYEYYLQVFTVLTIFTLCMLQKSFPCTQIVQVEFPVTNIKLNHQGND